MPEQKRLTLKMRTMKTANRFVHLFLLAAGFCSTTAGAQNILNDTILVSANAAVTVKFQADPTHSKIPDGDGSYELGNGGKKALLIKVLKPGAKDQTLVVEEGSRRHEFVLAYSDKPAELVVDWSNKKKLNEYVKNRSAQTKAALTEADALFNNGDYDAAGAAYSRWVNNVEGAERETIYVKIDECNRRGQAGKQKRYKEAMAAADTYAAARKYKEADAAYAEALAVMPDEAEAQKKSAANKSAWYKESAKKGDEADNAKNFILAQALYDEARLASPKDFAAYYEKKYKRVAADAAGQTYRQQKTAGDEAFQVEDFDVARAAYDSALRVKPNDADCTAKLAKVKEAHEKAKAVKLKEAEYYSILSTAKKKAATAITAKDYDDAIELYKKADRLFGDKKFPKEKMEAVTKLKSAAANR